MICSALLLEDEGLEVERSAFDLDTAFVARAGRTGPHIAVICEYDALPEIGHACGHNVIAAAGLGAGLAAASLADDLGGRVSIIGTPAEEGGGGKCFLLERGAFDGVQRGHDGPSSQLRAHLYERHRSGAIGGDLHWSVGPRLCLAP